MSTRYLGSLKRQQYSSGSEEDGVKKPLNAFLGELFIGSFKDEDGQGETKMITEQVRCANSSIQSISRLILLDPSKLVDYLQSSPLPPLSRFCTPTNDPATTHL